MIELVRSLGATRFDVTLISAAGFPGMLRMVNASAD